MLKTKCVNNITPKQNKKQNERHRVANMIPEQHEKNKAKYCVENMTAEQHKRKSERIRAHKAWKRAKIAAEKKTLGELSASEINTKVYKSTT